MSMLMSNTVHQQQLFFKLLEVCTCGFYLQGSAHNPNNYLIHLIRSIPPFILPHLESI